MKFIGVMVSGWCVQVYVQGMKYEGMNPWIVQENFRATRRVETQKVIVTDQQL